MCVCMCYKSIGERIHVHPQVKAASYRVSRFHEKIRSLTIVGTDKLKTYIFSEIQGHANQNYNEISPHPCPNGYY